MEKFYLLQSKLETSSIQVQPIGLKKTIGDELPEAFRLLKGNYKNINFPVVFQQQYGIKKSDLLDTGWAVLFLISEKFKLILQNNFLTGWNTFEVRVLDKVGNQIEHYYGFSVMGKSGNINLSSSEITEKKLVPNGQLKKYYCGLCIESASWDGSDFFIANNYYGIIVSSKAAEIIESQSLTNITLTNLYDVQFDEQTVEVMKRKNTASSN